VIRPGRWLQHRCRERSIPQVAAQYTQGRRSGFPFSDQTVAHSSPIRSSAPSSPAICCRCCFVAILTGFAWPRGLGAFGAQVRATRWENATKVLLLDHSDSSSGRRRWVHSGRWLSPSDRLWHRIPDAAGEPDRHILLHPRSCSSCSSWVEIARLSGFSLHFQIHRLYPRGAVHSGFGTSSSRTCAARS